MTQNLIYQACTICNKNINFIHLFLHILILISLYGQPKIKYVFYSLAGLSRVCKTTNSLYLRITKKIHIYIYIWRYTTYTHTYIHIYMI